MLFQYGKAVSGNFFYDRNRAQAEVKKLLKSKQSFMLKAPRRYGKTSLIKQVLSKNEIDYFYIDLRKIPRLELFNEKLIDYIYSQVGIKGFLQKIKGNIIGFLREHKATIKINVELFEASVELFTREDISECERLVDALDMAEKFADDLGRTFYIVMDEFQDIKRHGCKKMDVLEMMRGVMQHHDSMCYIFLGSHMTMMTEIFENKKSPFFNFCRKINLKAFDIDEIADELIDAFKTKQAVFENSNDLKAVLHRLKGHPANTMMVMQNLEFAVDDMEVKLISRADVEGAYQLAFEECTDLIGEYLREIQTKEHLHDVIYRIASKEKQALDSKLIYQKFSFLEKMGYLRKIARGEYEIIDGFLEDSLKEL